MNRLKLFHFLVESRLWFPVWVHFLLENGFSLFAIGVADALFWAIVALLEMPLGLISDKIGHKAALLISTLLSSLSLALLALAGSQTMLIVCWSVWAVSVAMSSGTDVAYRFEYIVAKEGGDTPSIRRHFGHFVAIGALASVASQYIGGVLYSFESRLPFIVNSCVYVVSAILLLSLKTQNELPHPRLGFYGIIREIKRITTQPRVAVILLGGASLFVFYWTPTIITQPRLSEIGIDSEDFGLIYCGLAVMGIAGGAMFSHILLRATPSIILFSHAPLLIFGVAIVSSSNIVFALIGAALWWYSFAVLLPLFQIAISRRASIANRATCLSIMSLCSSVALSVTRPVTTSYAGHKSAGEAFALWAMIGGAVLVGSLLLMPRAIRPKSPRTSLAK